MYACVRVCMRESFFFFRFSATFPPLLALHIDFATHRQTDGLAMHFWHFPVYLIRLRWSI